MRIPPKKILLFGRSLGSGPTVDLAKSLGRNLGGVILIAAVASCVRVVFKKIKRTPRFDMFPNIDKIQGICVPVLFVHGLDDDIVPFNHSLQLCQASRYPLEPVWIPLAKHNNLESSRFRNEVFQSYIKAIQEIRRWQPPVEYKNPAYSAVSNLFDSFRGLVKSTGCFRSNYDNGPDRFQISDLSSQREWSRCWG